MNIKLHTVSAGLSPFDRLPMTLASLRSPLSLNASPLPTGEPSEDPCHFVHILTDPDLVVLRAHVFKLISIKIK